MIRRKMRRQEVNVDVSLMMTTAIIYLGLVFSGWLLFRLIQACFWLPKYLKSREETSGKSESFESEELKDVNNETNECNLKESYNNLRPDNKYFNVGRYVHMSLEPGIEKGIPCPAPISRLRVEKIEGGLVVAGVVVAANCQVALPIFGFLFILVGIVLTVASYRGPGKDEAPENYKARIAFTGNSRILGPACIVVGIVMLAAGVGLCLLTRKARKRERRVGFHCPVHGDFYPLSPVMGLRGKGRIDSKWGSWFTRNKNLDAESMARIPPQCPHTQFSSARSSFSSNPPSPCPTPMPFLVTSGSISSGLINSIGINLSPDQTFGSIRSLSVSREVASFPLSRTPTPPLLERSSSQASLTEENKDAQACAQKEVKKFRTNTNNYNNTSMHDNRNNNCESTVNNGIDNYTNNVKSSSSGFSSDNINNSYNSKNDTVITLSPTKVSPVSKSHSLSAQSLSRDESQPQDSIAQVSKGPRKSVSIILPDEKN